MTFSNINVYFKLHLSYSTCSSHECTGVNGEALPVHAHDNIRMCVRMYVCICVSAKLGKVICLKKGQFVTHGNVVHHTQYMTQWNWLSMENSCCLAMEVRRMVTGAWIAKDAKSEGVKC